MAWLWNTTREWRRQLTKQQIRDSLALSSMLNNKHKKSRFNPAAKYLRGMSHSAESHSSKDDMRLLIYISNMVTGQFREDQPTPCLAESMLL